jgi:hypothetical protein
MLAAAARPARFVPPEKVVMIPLVAAIESGTAANRVRKVHRNTLRQLADGSSIRMVQTLQKACGDL